MSITLKSERLDTEKRQAVIVSAVRTPMGSFNGVFSSVPATKLGSIAIVEALKRVHVLPEHVDDVLMGCVLSAGLGQAPARQASIGAGIPHSIGATTVNKVCGSSIKTVMMASQTIALGEANIVVAGGMENMTRAPYLLEKARQGYRLGHAEMVDSVIKDGLWDVYNNNRRGLECRASSASPADWHTRGWRPWERARGCHSPDVATEAAYYGDVVDDAASP